MSQLDNEDEGVVSVCSRRHSIPSKMGEQRFTMAEVGSRNGEKGSPVWVVYKDSVYDVTSYINEHPGGSEAIREEAGRDATNAIDEVGHSSDARQILAKHKIGELVEVEKKYDANGKKKKRVVEAQPEGNSRGCLNTVTCGLLG